MKGPRAGLHLPAGAVYRNNRTINRTDLCRLRPMTDLQAMAPSAWCIRCGAEVYRRGMTRCRRCRGVYHGG